MQLTEMKVKDFNELLASNAPAPGGGSASALAGAMGAGLCSMVAALTIGREKYAADEELAKELNEKARKLSAILTECIDKDTMSFEGVSAVFSMPKSTDEEKAARKKAMQKALKEATLVPFSVMEHCLEALELANRAVGHTNTNAASDLGVCALNLKSAVQGAWLNVLINIGGIKDEEFVQEYSSRGKKLVEKASQIADDIYGKILESLTKL